MLCTSHHSKLNGFATGSSRRKNTERRRKKKNTGDNERQGEGGERRKGGKFGREIEEGGEKWVREERKGIKRGREGDRERERRWMKREEGNEGEMGRMEWSVIVR